MKVCVVGLGRAGLPLAAVMADAGLEVVGYDVDPERVAAINKKENPIPEELGLSELIGEHSGKGLKASSDIGLAADCDAYVVVVPLFLDEDNQPDYSLLELAFADVATVLADDDLVVLETTVPPGTTQDLVAKALDASGKNYLLAYSPERIMTGVSISRYSEFPKVVGGVDEASTQAAAKLYKVFSSEVVKVSSARCAELVKVAEGVYRDVNIGLANELYKIAKNEGVDYWELKQAANHRFCHLHEPGLVGGHCIPVYPWFLIGEYDAHLIRCARQLNEDMVEYYAQRAYAIAGEGGKVAVAGLSYRAGVREAHHTKAHQLIAALREKDLQVFGFDPQFTGEEIKTLFQVEPVDDLTQVDAVILSYNVGAVSLTPEKTVDVKGQLRETK